MILSRFDFYLAVVCIEHPTLTTSSAIVHHFHSHPSILQPAGKGKKDYSLPTSDELSNLRETSELFKSNLFKLQIDELLKEVRVDLAHTKPLQQFLQRLKKTIDVIPEQQVRITVSHSIRKIYFQVNSSCFDMNMLSPFPVPVSFHQVNVPHGACVLGFALDHGHASCAFTFRAPSRVDLVGSFLLRTAARPVLNVDVALEMPAACLGAKDYLNYRYLEKRACYLDVVAQYLHSRFVSHCTRPPIGMYTSPNSPLCFAIQLIVNLSFSRLICHPLRRLAPSVWWAISRAT